MSRLLRLAKPEILKWFEAHSPRVFSFREISRILAQHQDEWRLPEDLSTADAIEFLRTEARLRQVILSPIHHTSTPSERRYTWGDVSPFQLALSLKSQAYLSHATAMFLHGLSDQIPGRIYVNKEQSAKGSRESTLTQAGIDRAFSSKQRESRFVFRVGDSEAVLLWGKNTGRLEVGPMPYRGTELDVTRLERTLIDIAVRPAYAGGAYQVLEAYRRALQKGASVGTVVATLRKIRYVYPYHQAIGFYMQKAGFAEAQYIRLREFGMNFDFYLTYGLKEGEYNSEWRLFVPKGFQ